MIVQKTVTQYDKESKKMNEITGIDVYKRQAMDAEGKLRRIAG